jgi:hypothetical protein
MGVRRRVLACAVVAIAAVASHWAVGGSFAPSGLDSDHPSASSAALSSTTQSAVLESRTPSFVRGLTGDRPSQSALAWGLLIGAGLIGAGAAAWWTRLSIADRASDRLRALRGTVALRAPPSGRLA